MGLSRRLLRQISLLGKRVTFVLEISTWMSIQSIAKYKKISI